jgi:phosphoglycolate phosphatase
VGTSRLVLWDIDHTLISTGGVGSEVMRAAFAAATGVELAQPPDPTGLTEAQIFAEGLRLQGLSDPGGWFESFARAQVSGYRDRASDLRDRGTVLPGVVDILTVLAGTDMVVQSVLSGNVRAAGAAKLEAFDLARLLDLEVSAGGDDDPVRAALVPIAWERVAAKYGREFGPADTVLIGDTPADIETGHSHGCRVLAVATGKTSSEELSLCGADAVLPDLSNAAVALRLILM